MIHLLANFRNSRFDFRSDRFILFFHAKLPQHFSIGQSFLELMMLLHRVFQPGYLL